jgi:hypothetical protein
VAAADVLQKYCTEFPKNVLFAKWVEDLTRAEKEQCLAGGIAVCIFSCLILPDDQDPRRIFSSQLIAPSMPIKPEHKSRSPTDLHR